MSELSRPVSRRDALRIGAMFGGGAALASFLAACASSSDSSSAAAGTGASGGSGKTVGVALLAPITGVGSAWGSQTADGLKSAAKYVNLLGGIKSMGGAQLSVTVLDTETTPSVAQSAAQKAALDDSISVITGCNQSGASIIVSQVAAQNQIPFVTGSDIDPRIPTSGNGWTFQIPSQASGYVTALMDFMVSEFKASGTPIKLAMLSSNSDLGQTCTTFAVDYAKKLGIEVVATDYYDSTKVSDFTPFISKYASKGANAIIGTQDPQPAVLIVRAMKQLKWEPKFVGGLDGSWGLTQWATDTGTDANYVYSSQPWASNVKGLGMEQFIPAFTAKMNRAPNDYDLTGFSVMSVVAAALERAGSSDRQKLRDALTQTDIKAGTGDIPLMQYAGAKFDSTGKNSMAQNLVMMTKDKANFVVSPAEYSGADPIFPRPGWASL